jgi:hypothetical protein
VTTILSTRDISIHPEPPINTSHLLTRHNLRNECLDSAPEFVVESLIDDPVEVVGEDARVLALRPHRRVGNELYCLSSCDD